MSSAVLSIPVVDRPLHLYFTGVAGNPPGVVPFFSDDNKFDKKSISFKITSLLQSVVYSYRKVNYFIVFTRPDNSVIINLVQLFHVSTGNVQTC